MVNMRMSLKFVIPSMTFVFLLFSHVGLISAQVTTILISPENQSISVQQNFIIAVVVDPGTAIAGVQFDLRFDPSLVTAVSVSEGTLFSQGGANTYFKTPTINNETGVIVGVAGVVLGPNTVSSSGTFAIIQMRAKSTEGISTLALENVEIVDENGVAVTTTTQSGSVIIIGAPEEGEGSNTTFIIGAAVLTILGGILVAILVRRRKYSVS